MKKQLIRIVSIVLICVLSILTLSSCGILISGASLRRPKGYTGGFGFAPGSTTDYFWVETYEEAQAAIELLKSHGSTFYKSAIVNYEGDLFDTKYCFEFSGKSEAYWWNGESPFDRWAEQVQIRTYCFFEDVTIEEIEYSYVRNYDVLYFLPESDFYTMHETDNTIDPDSLTFDWVIEHSSAMVEVEGYTYFQIYRQKNNNHIDLSDECVYAVLNSMVFIGDLHYYN